VVVVTGEAEEAEGAVAAVVTVEAGGDATGAKSAR
jgi:hypothetical protein